MRHSSEESNHAMAGFQGGGQLRSPPDSAPLGMQSPESEAAFDICRHHGAVAPAHNGWVKIGKPRRRPQEIEFLGRPRGLPGGWRAIFVGFQAGKNKGAREHRPASSNLLPLLLLVPPEGVDISCLCLTDCVGCGVTKSRAAHVPETETSWRGKRRPTENECTAMLDSLSGVAGQRQVECWVRDGETARDVPHRCGFRLQMTGRPSRTTLSLTMLSAVVWISGAAPHVRMTTPLRRAGAETPTSEFVALEQVDSLSE